MEIAFFLAGITRTASDQSISIGTASGSFATALAMSSSVSASKRAQSVLPFRRSPHFRVTIFSFFIFPCAARRDNPDDVCPPRKGYGDQSVFQRTYREPSLLIVAVRSTKDDWSIKDLDRVVEIDAVFDAIKLVLLFVPIEGSQDRFSYLFVRHSPHSR